MTNAILVFSSDIEAVEFVAFLNKNGIDAELTNSEPDAERSQRESGHDVNNLWENYCNS